MSLPAPKLAALIQVSTSIERWELCSFISQTRVTRAPVAAGGLDAMFAAARLLGLRIKEERPL